MTKNNTVHLPSILSEFLSSCRFPICKNTDTAN